AERARPRKTLLAAAQARMARIVVPHVQSAAHFRAAAGDSLSAESMRLALRAFFAASIPAVALALQAACGASPDPKLCGQTPVGGCPIGRGGSCLDRSCSQLFDCVEGVWTLTMACPENGRERDGGPETGAPDACTPFVVDAGGETGPCTDLELP